jgi:hypothetical protein
LKEATSVISGLAVEPTSPPSMSVIVRAGTAVIGGTVVSLASDTTVAVPTPDATYPRFDLVTLKSTGAVGYYTGTPEAAVAVDTAKPETYVKPKPPSTPVGEVALAEVFVPAGATAIDKIIDRRIVMGLNTSQITSGRFPMARMPDGASGKVLIAQGVGVDPAYADPNFNLIQVGGTALTARDWSSDFAKLQNLDILLSAIKAVGTETPRTLSNIYDQIGATQPRNIAQWGGTALTGRDISGDLAKLQNLDILLSAHRDALLSKLDEFGRLVPLASTTTPLAAGGSWTSTVDSDVTTGRIVGSVFANQAGTLYIEQSPDNTNWDIVDSFSVSANVGLGFSVEKVVPYARVRYVNGATAQTVFRLYVYVRRRVI